MLPLWVIEEMINVDLEDKRLDKRFKRVLAALGAHPTASIPAACGGYAETTAAYRFFANGKVTFGNVLQPHLDSTMRRVAVQPIALLVNDTTELDVTRPQQQVHGAGPLDGGSRRGALLHEMHAFTPNGTPLGTIDAMTWVREDGKPTNSGLTRGQRRAIPMEEKESIRWVQSMEKACEIARLHPQTRIVYLADSEADAYEVLAEAAEHPRGADWIVRSCQDRALVDDAEDKESSDYLREELLQSPALFRKQIHVRGREAKTNCEHRSRRQPRKSREAIVEVRATRVTLRAPERSAGQLPDITVNAVMVTEVSPPEGDVPVEWVLITSLSIDTIDDIRISI
jgi:hypothetical protein